MAEIRAAAPGQLDPAQALELASLVDAEAGWENLRKPWPGQADAGMTSKDLSSKQSAYHAFHSKLVAYNKSFTPAHVPELLLNTPARLGGWCRTMQKLFFQVEQDSQCQCPVHVLQKAYRWADRIGIRLNCELVSRTSPPGTIQDVIRELETVAQWCASAEATTA